MAADIDPVEYGKLIRAVEQMETEMAAMKSDIKELLELANKGKGGFWAGMAMASAISAAIGWFISSWTAK